jgi:hypothetical protein
MANKIADQPAFAWWVPFVLRKWDRIVASINLVWRYHVPYKGHYRLIKKQNTNFWALAIEKEISMFTPCLQHFGS